MDGITKDSIKTAKLMKQLWPQLTDKEAIDEVKRYTNGKNTAIFTEVEGDTIVGLALCSLRFDYVVQNVRNGRKIKDVRNLQVTVL